MEASRSSGYPSRPACPSAAPAPPDAGFPPITQPAARNVVLRWCGSARERRSRPRVRLTRTRTRLPALASVFGRTFAHEPMMRWPSASNGDLAERFTRCFAYLLEAALPLGLVREAEQAEGAAVWIPHLARQPTRTRPRRHQPRSPARVPDDAATRLSHVATRASRCTAPRHQLPPPRHPRHRRLALVTAVRVGDRLHIPDPRSDPRARRGHRTRLGQQRADAQLATAFPRPNRSAT
jgi:hypothetical protein